MIVACPGLVGDLEEVDHASFSKLSPGGSVYLELVGQLLANQIVLLVYRPIIFENFHGVSTTCPKPPVIPPN